ncbi:MAG TPA: hypothetical protein VFC09_16480 [Candidatus Dormibacteraeota bacterium]|nr:hypothetical protein [Candidatus Dormibacteraeota bacterium]
MADGMDGFEQRLRQRLAETLEDAAAAPRRRLPLPGAAARRGHPRWEGFAAGVATAALLFGVLWATLGRSPAHPGPSVAPSTNAGRVISSVSVADPVFTIAAGEGGVWVPDDASGKLLRIDPRSGRIAATIPIAVSRLASADAFDAVATSPGAVWVTSAVDDALVRVDPATNRVAQRIALGVRPSSLAVLGSDVWVTASQADRVLRVAVASGTVEASVAVTDPGPIAAGAGGVWVVSEREGELSRIDPTTNVASKLLSAAPGSDYVVDAVVASGDGVWFRNLAARSVQHLDAASTLITQQAGVGGTATWGVTDPLTIAATNDAVWVTVTNALVRVDRRTLHVTQLPLIQPTGVATAADDGSLWLATAQGAVVHVAPGTG